MTRAIAALVVGAALGAVLAGGQYTETPLPPCPTEDSVNCYWDAQTRGNHIGHDVVIIEEDSK